MKAHEARQLAHPAFAEIDRQFAALLERLAGGGQPEVALAAALASRRAREGARFVDLQAPDAGVLGGEPAELKVPERESWLERLRASRVVGAPGEFKPLILDPRGRLYLHRCWVQEQPMPTIVAIPSDKPARDAGDGT